MNKIIQINQIRDFVVVVNFNDGDSKTIDFSPLIGQGISSKLLDKEYFQKVSIDNGGGLKWPNGMDFCPNFLKEYTPKNELLTEHYIAQH